MLPHAPGGTWGTTGVQVQSLAKPGGMQNWPAGQIAAGNSQTSPNRGSMMPSPHFVQEHAFGNPGGTQMAPAMQPPAGKSQTSAPSRAPLPHVVHLQLFGNPAPTAAHTGLPGPGHGSPAGGSQSSPPDSVPSTGPIRGGGQL